MAHNGQRGQPCLFVKEANREQWQETVFCVHSAWFPIDWSQGVSQCHPSSLSRFTPQLAGAKLLLKRMKKIHLNQAPVPHAARGGNRLHYRVLYCIYEKEKKRSQLASISHGFPLLSTFPREDVSLTQNTCLDCKSSVLLQIQLVIQSVYDLI